MYVSYTNQNAYNISQPLLMLAVAFLPPQGCCPEGKILSRLPSSLCVYKEKYLELKYAVSIPEKILVCFTGVRWNHWVMMAFQCWMFNAECPQVRNYIIQKIPNGIAWIDFDSHCKFIVWHSYALCVCSLTFCGAAVLKVFKQNWNFNFFVSCYCLKQASKSHSPQI